MLTLKGNLFGVSYFTTIIRGALTFELSKELHTHCPTWSLKCPLEVN